MLNRRSERAHWRRLAKQISAIADKRNGPLTLVVTVGSDNVVTAEVRTCDNATQ